MNIRRVARDPRFITGMLVALFFAVALILRVVLPYDKILGGEWVKFSGSDAYFHMRLVDNLVHNFPHLTAFDPYLIFPGGGGVGGIRFFDQLLAGIIWLVGLGSPTQHTIDVVGAYFPAVLAALTVIPVYFIGKELFGRWAGVLSAGLIAIMPGEFLGRSILGFTDHHVAEVLFTAVAVMFLIMAIRRADQAKLTFDHVRRLDWSVLKWPMVFSFLAGLFLGIYIYTFLGALIFVFIIFIYFVVQFIIDHLRRKSTDYLCFTGFVFFLVALVISLLVSAGVLYTASLVISLLALVVLSGISWLMARREINPAFYPLALLGVGLAGLGIFYAASPTIFRAMLDSFSVFTPTITSLTTIEVQPIFSPGGNFSLYVVWGNFTTGFFFFWIGLGLLIWSIYKQGGDGKALLVVWSLVMFAAMVGQRRFAYYFAVNVALLTGYLSWRALSLIGLKELTAAGAVDTAKKEPAKKAPPSRARGRRAAQKKTGFTITVTQVNVTLAAIIVFFAAYFPNLVVPGTAIDTAKQAQFAPSDAWLSSLDWLRENTPEPLGNPDAYYGLYDPPPSGQSYAYPASAYGVLSWWDYGYWITRMGHRIPNANPSQKPEAIKAVASFFTSQNETSANDIAQELGSRYVVMDYETAFTKLYAVILWSGNEQLLLGDIYYLSEENTTQQYLYPEYYRLLSTRLYNFDGQAVTPQSTRVISYRDVMTPDGMFYKEVTSTQDFATYEEAEAYLQSQESGNYRIVGTDPFSSPVPLEALAHYRLVHGSEGTVTLGTAGAVPAVKIFEYVEEGNETQG